MFSIKKAVKNMIKHSDRKVKDFEYSIDHSIEVCSYCGRNWTTVTLPNIEEEKIKKVLDKYIKAGYKVSEHRSDIRIEW